MNIMLDWKENFKSFVVNLYASALSVSILTISILRLVFATLLIVTIGSYKILKPSFYFLNGLLLKMMIKVFKDTKTMNESKGKVTDAPNATNAPNEPYEPYKVYDENNTYEVNGIYIK